MLSAREYIDITITKRLNKQKPTDITVNDDEYNRIVSDLNNLISKTSRENKIPGFTPEDLQSFFYMQIHQSIRRCKYDPDKPAFPYFVRAFRNLLADIVRMRNNCVKNNLTTDPLDECAFWIENDKML